MEPFSVQFPPISRIKESASLQEFCETLSIMVLPRLSTLFSLHSYSLFRFVQLLDWLISQLRRLLACGLASSTFLHEPTP